MSLTLHYHPLSSACWKVLVALYENDTRFEGRVVDLLDPAQRAEFAKISPLVKFPVLVDAVRARVVPETSIIIEHLARHYPGKVALIPADPDAALEARLWDRVYDFYVHDPMQRVVADRLRPKENKDPYGVEQLKSQIQQAYALIEQQMGQKPWAAGDDFTLADCAACPALYYANRVSPIAESQPNVRAYLKRLMERASFARVLREAEPYAAMFPKE
ncbi:MAG TPA: glutathione S-transferase family protein [Polyangiaceae bacterium]